LIFDELILRISLPNDVVYWMLQINVDFYDCNDDDDDDDDDVMIATLVAIASDWLLGAVE